jgi:hypothetical protein
MAPASGKDWNDRLLAERQPNQTKVPQPDRGDRQTLHSQTTLITGNYMAVGGKRADIEIADSRTGQPRTVSVETLQHPYYWAPFILIGNGL